jgi:ketosteroid isomerase-like protein
MSVIRHMVIALVVQLLVVGGAATQTQDAGDRVIAAERAALDRWSKGDTGGFLDSYADEITYFAPGGALRVDGIEAMRAALAPAAGKFSIARYELIRPKVQRYGDVAVLSYNLVNYGRDKSGAETVMNRWNSTTVYHLQDGRWLAIHSHWSLTQPSPAPPPQAKQP